MAVVVALTLTLVMLALLDTTSTTRRTVCTAMLLAAPIALSKEYALHVKVATSWQTAPAVYTAVISARNVPVRKNAESAELTLNKVFIYQQGLELVIIALMDAKPANPLECAPHVRVGIH